MYAAGVESSLSDPSIARAFTVCVPSARRLNVRAAAHGSYAAPSSRHSNVAPASGDANLNAAVVAVVVLPGPLATVVSGGVLSTSHAAFWLATPQPRRVPTSPAKRSRTAQRPRPAPALSVEARQLVALGPEVARVRRRTLAHAQRRLVVERRARHVVTVVVRPAGVVGQPHRRAVGTGHVDHQVAHRRVVDARARRGPGDRHVQVLDAPAVGYEHRRAHAGRVVVGDRQRHLRARRRVHLQRAAAAPVGSTIGTVCVPLADAIASVAGTSAPQTAAFARCPAKPVVFDPSPSPAAIAG